MKTVFTNDMVAHIWAQQNQHNGRNANDSFYFSGKIIYSYNDSFPIAKFITDNIVLFTTQHYSVTTSQHCSNVRQAINYKTIFNVPNVDLKLSVKGCNQWTKNDNKLGHKKNVEYYKDEIKKTVLKASRARQNKDWLNNQALQLLSEANQYIKTFKLRYKTLSLPDSATLLASAKKVQEKARIATIKRNKEILKANQEKITNWLNGENVSLHWNIEKVYLRIVNREDESIVQTSKNATFPCSHALKAYRLIKACKKHNKTFVKNGKSIHLGHFQIDSIDTNGNVKAGCHFVEFDQIELIGEKLLKEV